MTYETLTLTRDDRGVTDLVLNRPDRRNAMDAAMIGELTEVARGPGADPAVRAVVLSGAGPVFCAGGDLAWMMQQIEADRAGRMREARKLAEMLRALNEMPSPVIARVHGGAYGGGLGLMAVCDVAVVAEGTKMALTETGLGLIPATIGPYVVARMGEGAARRVFMSGRRFGATEAVALGLAAAAVAPDDLDAAVAAEVAPYLQVAPGAVGAAKALVRSLGPRIDDAVIDDTIRRLADTWEGAEAKAGIAAFLAKSAPPWRSA
ncbi:crotonase/enoyl-CoA hydratase family protein [Rhodobacteraceae bacterium CCMM004]|nr:crotonase/enoyl-CoA hydratase family protein [Rhodobacteraceae bacterium CCMM004]